MKKNHMKAKKFLLHIFILCVFSNKMKMLFDRINITMIIKKWFFVFTYPF